MNAPLHEAVRRARKERRMTQAALAEAAGVRRNLVARLEAGKNVTVGTVAKIIPHLPNLDAFTLEGATVTCRRREDFAGAVDEAAVLLARALEVVAGALVAASAEPTK